MSPYPKMKGYFDHNVGLLLNDERIVRISDLYVVDGLWDNAIAIILTEGGEFKLVGRAGDSGDIPVVGGQGFIMVISKSTSPNPVERRTGTWVRYGSTLTLIPDSRTVIVLKEKV